MVELKFAAGSLKFRVLDLKETVKKEEAASLYEILSNSARHALVPLCRCVSERPFPAPCADSTRVRISRAGRSPVFRAVRGQSPRSGFSRAGRPLFSSAPCAAFLKGDIVKIYVILPAAGSGSRAGFEKNKILQKIGGRVPFFAPFPPLPPCPRSQRSPCASANGTGKRFARFSPRFRRPSRRGRTDAHAIGEKRSGKLAQDAPDYVLIHDAARPFVSEKIIRDCIRTAESFGSACAPCPARTPSCGQRTAR